ncbi:hypothetical protein UFOVP199_26 [uncultured Caudovirales phage]|uniref:Glycine-rich domain-containing protein n=1 Tax=uncultured Caudovirales phage TaxID=2100421 RepID=A0A6J7WHQ2_9CAUD|nr:hypothetical protein UFOVP199_26 [uncultured Caudovirales phage]
MSVRRASVSGLSGVAAKSLNYGFVVATGGTISDAGGYRYHTFLNSGTFAITSGNVIGECLLVGGGASGGTGTYGNGGLDNGHGAGSGGTLLMSMAVTPQSLTVTIANGGASQAGENTNGNAGGTTYLGQLYASGGASGGGMTGGTSGNGYTGGTGGAYAGGGGGGAGGNGGNQQSTYQGGVGGVGLSFPSYASFSANGGLLGGGGYGSAGSGSNAYGGGGPGSSAVANTGGGGGGAYGGGGSGAGGKGIVVVRYPI